MPECYEPEADKLLALNIYNESKDDVEKWKVKRLLADVSDKEQKSSPKDSPQAKGMVYELSRSSTVKRGINRAQKPLYPPYFKKDNALVQTLRLNGIHLASRSMVLDLGPLWLMVSRVSISFLLVTESLKLQYLTHTSVQFYKKTVWETTVMCVSKKVHSFR